MFLSVVGYAEGLTLIFHRYEAHLRDIWFEGVKVPNRLVGHTVMVTRCTIVKGRWQHSGSNINPEIHSSGVSICTPADQFNVAKGRVLALTRAMKTNRFSRNGRAMVWVAYFRIFRKPS